MGREYLVEGAMLMCLNGTNPTKLKVPGGHGYTSGGKNKANCKDCTMCKNIDFFGSCRLNTATYTCAGFMQLDSKWLNTSLGMLSPEKVDGEEALTMDSVLICKKGGLIFPLTSGQGYNSKIDWKAFKKRVQNAVAWAMGKGYASLRQGCCKLGADPINLNTGNYIYEKEDLIIPGRAQLAFRLFYNSMEKGKGGSLGVGWHHNYDIFIKEEDNGRTLTVCMEDGRQVRYIRSIRDVYEPVLGDIGLLKKEKDGYRYCMEGGKEYFFGSEGRLYACKDGNGNTDTLLYNAKGQLEKVKGAGGGELNYIYNGEGSLIRVRDHTGREVQIWYRYRKLWKFVNSLRQAYFYEYNEDGCLESVVTPRGIQGVFNEYDGIGRVVKQILPDGGVTELMYDDLNMRTYMKEPNDNMVTYESDERFRNVKTIYEDGEEITRYNGNNQKTLHIDKLGNKTKFQYDEKGNLTGVTDALGNTKEFMYDSEKRITSVKLPGGGRIFHTYDREGNLTERIDPCGNAVRMSYNSYRQPEKIWQPDGSEVCMEYDGRGNITGLTDTMGNRTAYEYDALNRVTAVTDGNGSVTRFTYNERNDIVKVVNALGMERRYEYGLNGKVTGVTDFDGHAVKAVYDASNRMEIFEDKEGIQTAYVYDTMGNLTEEKMPNGGMHTYTFDKMNRVTAYTDELGGRTEYEYDANGNCTKISEPGGKITFYTYDALNRIARVTEGDGLETVYEYTPLGKVSKVLYPGGLTEETAYDACGRETQVKDIHGNVIRYQYNSIGKITCMEDDDGKKTIFDYFAGGTLKKIQYPDGTWDEYAYDGNGNVTEKKNQEGYILRYAYDALGRMVSVSSNMGEKKEYEYDACGNVTAMTDGNGNTKRYEYSPEGNLISVTDAEGNESIYGYDCMGALISTERKAAGRKGAEPENPFGSVLASEGSHMVLYERDIAGNLAGITDALGNKVSYSYDSKGRMIKKKDKDGGETLFEYGFAGNIQNIKYADGRSVEYEYDALRKLVKIKDWLGETLVEPDLYGRAVKVTDHAGQTVGYEYGKRGEKSAVIYPDGERVEYRYDELMRLSSVHTVNGDIRYHYDGNGRLREKMLPGGVSSCYLYDRSGRITKIINSDGREVIDEQEYAYDRVGNKTEIVKKRRGIRHLDGRYSFLYDKENRLTGVRRNGEDIRQYAYDGYGNRVYMNQGGQETWYAYNEADQLVGMDGNGSRKYTYDRRGNLTGVYGNGKMLAEYEYDSASRIIYAAMENGKYSRYLYNGLGQRVGEQKGGSLPGDGSVSENLFVVDITSAYNNLLQETEGGKTSKYIWDDGVLAMAVGDSRRYYVRDDLKSPMRFLYQNGRLSEAYDYDEFGNLQHGEWEGEQPFGFTGYRKDAVSGNYFAQAREYMPENGRFAGADVFGGNLDVPASLNKYLYCFQNPLIYWDPWGYFTPEEGIEAHVVLQTVALGTYPGNAEVEKSVKGNPNTKTGGGRIDIYLNDNGDGMAEVYEIKPISHYKDEKKREEGMEQREGYIVGLRSMGVRNIDEEGTTFNPNYLTLPCPSKPGKSIRYYTYPDAPGMIYYGYVNTPKEEPKPKFYPLPRPLSEQEKSGWKAVGGVVLLCLVSLAFIYFLGPVGAIVLADNGTGGNGCDAIA